MPRGLRLRQRLAVSARARPAELPPNLQTYADTGEALIAEPFRHGLAIVFLAALVMSVVAAGASWLRGGRYVHEELEASRAGALTREEQPT